MFCSYNVAMHYILNISEINNVLPITAERIRKVRRRMTKEGDDEVKEIEREREG